MGRSLPEMGNWVEMLHEADFADVDALDAWDGVTPATPDAWRLVLRARGTRS